ncbi:MAG: 4Fe-4S binding protein [Bacteroidales bacterium]|nr:4Fe-4S binding protein [Bacteroidales bacterium]
MQKKPSYATTGSLWKSMLLTLPMLLIMLVFMTGGKPDFSDIAHTVSFLIGFLFFGFLFFNMLYTGKTDLYRAIGFITISLFFAFTFIVNLLEVRGSMTFSNEEVLACEIPFCHIVTTMVIIPMAVKQSIIFSGSLLGGFAPVATMLVFVLGFSLLLGRGFCSWGCFYGGWDDGTSRILKKPMIRNVHSMFKWSSFAVLLIVAISSAFTLVPTYCDWLCPFKTVTEYEEITSLKVFFKTMVFVSLFLGLVIILPILTKKRIQCTTFCPMGALLSLTNKINIFHIKIDQEKCTKCKICAKTCPTLSIDADDIQKGYASMTCTKCGKCIDHCPKQAIRYHIKGTPMNTGSTLTRTLFLYPAFIMMIVFTGGTVQNGILLLFKLFTTGSLF